MPIAALAAPLIAEAVLPELGIAAGTLGAGAVTAGLGGALGAGSGALFGELTGGDPGKGALSGAIGGAAGPIGGALGEAIPAIGETAGATIGAAAGGAGGAALTGGNPLLGAAESAAVPLTNAAFGSGGVFGSTPSATVTPTATATGAVGPAASGGSVGAASAAAGSQIGLDPTAGGGAGPSGGGGAPSGGGTGGAGVDGSGAMFGDIGSQNTFFYPTGTTPDAGGETFSASGFSPIAGQHTDMSGVGGGGFGSDIMGLIQKNPGALLSGGLLASQLFRGNQTYPAEKTLQTMGTNTGTQGAALSSYIQSGTLPPGAQQAVTQATEGSKATLRENFARMGLSGSTMEGQALSNVDRQAAAQTFQFADQLLAQGANFTQISAQIQEALLKTQAGTDEEFQKSLMAFAGGLGGLRGTAG